VIHHELLDAADRIVRDAIDRLALECARDSLTGTPRGGVKLVRDSDPECFERLERMLGRPFTSREKDYFRVALELALVVQESSR
jgi:hypothetical protein